MKRRKKQLLNEGAIIARCIALRLAGVAVKTVRAAIADEYDQSVSYGEISEWTHDALQQANAAIVSNKITTLVMVLFPDGYEHMQPARRPFAILFRPGEEENAWTVRRSPVMSCGERLYSTTTTRGDHINVWAPSLDSWIAQMRRRGYRLNAYDPEAANAPQAELFTLHMKEAA
jgi:hypothetical protein